jgi:hypothetical protein
MDLGTNPVGSKACLSIVPLKAFFVATIDKRELLSTPSLFHFAGKVMGK